MGRQSDPRKASAWERRPGRLGNSGLTVARFYGRDGVLIATFHSRQRKLRDVSIDEAAGATPVASAGHFDPVGVGGRQDGGVVEDGVGDGGEGLGQRDRKRVDVEVLCGEVGLRAGIKRRMKGRCSFPPSRSQSVEQGLKRSFGCP